MQRNGEWQRLQRARHPNGNAETQGLHTQNVGTGWLPSISGDPPFPGVPTGVATHVAQDANGFREMPNANLISDAGVTPGQNSSKAALLGLVDTASDCETLCSADESCLGFTWHNTSVKTKAWARMCYKLLTQRWSSHYQANHFSCCKKGLADSCGGKPAPTPAPGPPSPSPNQPPSANSSWAPPLQWLGPRPFDPSHVFDVKDDRAERASPHFKTYKASFSGPKGPCADFSPPFGFWCGLRPEAGRTFTQATGVVLDGNKSGFGKYGWIPHNASFGFLDLAPSILHSNWFWDYIS
jgi:hypothetical protein